MKKLNTSNTGGHLLSLDDFRHIQEGFTETTDATIRALIGNGVSACILYGCQITRNGADFAYTAGAIFWNGEVYPVEAGSGVDNGNGLYWHVETSYAPYNPVRYESGEDYNVHEIRRMRILVGQPLPFGLTHESLLTLVQVLTQRIDFSFVADLVFAVGDIRMFRGNIGLYFDVNGKGITGTRYAKWAIADGRNGTVNLKGRVPVGLDTGPGADTDFNALGKTGGSKNVTLSLQQIPAHNHTATTDSAGSHTHTVGYQTKSTESGGTSGTWEAGSGSSKTTSSSGSHNHGVTVNNSGGGQPHTNMQPYMVICYIEKITE